ASVPYLNLRPAGAVNGQCHENPVAGCSWIRNAYRSRYAGSVSGGLSGGAGFKYYVSGTWDDNDGVLPLDNERKLVTRGNFGFSLFDNVRVDWNTMYGKTDLSNTPAGNNAHGLVLNVYRAERNYRNSSDPRVIDSLLNQTITSGIERLVTGGTVTYTPASWFSHRVTIGYDLAQQENRNLRPFGFVAAPQGILNDEQIRYSILTADYVGNLDFRLSPQLASTFSFGGQSITSGEVRTTAYAEGFPGPGLPVASNPAPPLASEARPPAANAGFFGPERTREAELGLDAALLGNRLTIAATWYHRLTTDALYSVRQISSLGFPQSQTANVGSMSNTGIELSVNGTLLNKPAWGLDLGGSVYTNHGLVRDLGRTALGPTVPFAAGGGWVEVGFPPMVARGIIINNPDAIAPPDTVCRSSCTADGFHIFGPQQPTLILGQSLTLRLPKGITIS